MFYCSSKIFIISVTEYSFGNIWYGYIGLYMLISIMALVIFLLFCFLLQSFERNFLTGVCLRLPFIQQVYFSKTSTISFFINTAISCQYIFPQLHNYKSLLTFPAMSCLLGNIHALFGNILKFHGEFCGFHATFIFSRGFNIRGWPLSNFSRGKTFSDAP